MQIKDVVETIALLTKLNKFQVSSYSTVQYFIHTVKMAFEESIQILKMMPCPRPSEAKQILVKAFK